jgi:hypothetical protein
MKLLTPNEATDRARSKTWIEIGRSIEQGKEAACEFLLSELEMAHALVDAVDAMRDVDGAGSCRASARAIHDSVCERLPRVGLSAEQEQSLVDCALTLRERLEALGERF